MNDSNTTKKFEKKTIIKKGAVNIKNLDEMKTEEIAQESSQKVIASNTSSHLLKAIVPATTSKSTPSVQPKTLETPTPAKETLEVQKSSPPKIVPSNDQEIKNSPPKSNLTPFSNANQFSGIPPSNTNNTTKTNSPVNSRAIQPSPIPSPTRDETIHNHRARPQLEAVATNKFASKSGEEEATSPPKSSQVSVQTKPPTSATQRQPPQPAFNQTLSSQHSTPAHQQEQGQPQPALGKTVSSQSHKQYSRAQDTTQEVEESSSVVSESQIPASWNVQAAVSSGSGIDWQMHSKLFPSKSNDNTIQLSEMFSQITSADPAYGLTRMLLAGTGFLMKQTFLTFDPTDVFQHYPQVDEWTQYYIKQFVIYSPGADFYEPWEVILMAVFNKDNKIFSLGKYFNGVTSERYQDLNTTKVLLDLVGGEFREDDCFFLNLCYILARESFCTEMAIQTIDGYLEFLADYPLAEARLCMLLLLCPSALSADGVRNRFFQYLRSDKEQFGVLGEYLGLHLRSDASQASTVLWLSLQMAEFGARRNMVSSVEDYVTMITNRRSSSPLINDPTFTQEFKKVRAIYLALLERQNGNGGQGNGAASALAPINQMFGFMKGIVKSATSTTGGKSSAEKSGGGNGNDEVKWDPVTKRWLINGQIPPDDPADEKPNPEDIKPAGPPPKKLPPAAGTSGVVEPRKTALGTKQKFVAYQIGANAPKQAG
jgi:hypothetical protein